MNSNAILRILGCGTSTGVPLAGCTCSVCKSNDSRDKRLRCSAWIKTSAGSSILIDAGPDLRQQALFNNIDRLDALVFTHAHADHILGLDDLRAFNFIQRQALACYATSATWQAIRRIFHYILEPDENYRGGLLTSITINQIEPYKSFTVAGLEILPLELDHGGLPVLGFRIGNLAYATDCNALADQSKQLLKNIDHLILDGLRYEPHPTHFTIPQAIQMAQDLGVKNTYLTHLAHTISYAQVNANLPPSVQLCYDGLEIPFEFAK